MLQESGIVRGVTVFVNGEKKAEGGGIKTKIEGT
jgi:hypothetical protein